MNLLVASAVTAAADASDEGTLASADLQDSLSMNMSIGGEENGDLDDGVLSEGEMQSFMSKIYRQHPFERRRETSRAQRAREGYRAATLSYCETPLATFREQFCKLYRHGLSAEDAVGFLDIGCGSGGVVFAAALCHNFRECTGIEILSDLHALCLSALKAWVKGGKQLGSKQDITITFRVGDALAMDLGSPTVVYCNLACFDGHMCSALVSKLLRLRSGTFVITSTKKIDSPLYLLLESSTGAMSFGEAAFYIHRRSDESYDEEPTDKEVLEVLMKERLYDE